MIKKDFRRCLNSVSYSGCGRLIVLIEKSRGLPQVAQGYKGPFQPHYFFRPHFSSSLTTTS